MRRSQPERDKLIAVALKEKGVYQKDIAKTFKISEARMSQIKKRLVKDSILK